MSSLLRDTEGHGGDAHALEKTKLGRVTWATARAASWSPGARGTNRAGTINPPWVCAPVRRWIVLRDDENHVSARSAQPPRVPVAGSCRGTSMSGSATRHQRQVPHGSGKRRPADLFHRPYPFGPVSSAPGGWVVAGLLDAVDGAPGSAELVGYLPGDVGRVSVFGGRMAVLVEAVVGLGQHLVCRGEHDDCRNHGNRADGEGHVQVEAFDELAGGEWRQSAAEEADEAVGGGGDRPFDRGHHHHGLGGQRVVDPDEDPGGGDPDDQDGAVVDEDRDDCEVGCEEQTARITPA